MKLPDAAQRLKDDISFRGLLEAAPDAIVAATEDGEIVVVNLQAEKIFGYSRDELIGQKIELLVPERHRTVHAVNRKTFAQERRARPMGAGVELFGRRKDGTEFPVGDQS